MCSERSPYPSNLPDQLEELLRETSAAARRSAREWRRRWEPELAYGRHYGPIRPTARQAAVLVLLYQRDDQWIIPLTRRTAHLASHPSQISLPGGMLEPGESAATAARREWEEEMGTSTSEFRLLGQMRSIFVFNSNFRVTPFVATTEQIPDYRPNIAEVDRVIEMPLSLLLAEQPRPDTHQVQRRGLEFCVPHLLWDGEQVWGATLQVLAELASYLVSVE